MPATSSPLSSDIGSDCQSEIDRRRGRFVPWLIAAFYLTFMSALIGFVFLAYQHPPETVTQQAYEKGLAYNDTIEKGVAQSRLGWSSSITWKPSHLTFLLYDHKGRPVAAETVKAWFVHPDKASLDRSVILTAVSPGQYTSAIKLPTKGLWNVHVTARSGSQQYQTVSQFQNE